MQPDQVHTMAWDWTVKAMDDLKKIAKEANKASKVGSLDNAVAMRAVEKKAIQGSLMVAKIFGEVKQASDPMLARVLRRVGGEGCVGGASCEAEEQPNEHMAVAPEGWEETVKEMKKDPDIENPWALAHWMKGEGYESHKDATYLGFANALFKASRG